MRRAVCAIFALMQKHLESIRSASVVAVSRSAETVFCFSLRQVDAMPS
jgi:hypothetical protein